METELEKFDLSKLDPFETMQYKHHILYMSKPESLRVLINTVEGDFTQLSESLADLAKRYKF